MLTIGNPIPRHPAVYLIVNRREKMAYVGSSINANLRARQWQTTFTYGRWETCSRRMARVLSSYNYVHLWEFVVLVDQPFCDGPAIRRLEQLTLNKMRADYRRFRYMLLNDQQTTRPDREYGPISRR